MLHETAIENYLSCNNFQSKAFKLFQVKTNFFPLYVDSYSYVIFYFAFPILAIR